MVIIINRLTFSCFICKFSIHMAPSTHLGISLALNTVYGTHTLWMYTISQLWMFLFMRCPVYLQDIFHHPFLLSPPHLFGCATRLAGSYFLDKGLNPTQATTVKARRSDPWTTREFPTIHFFTLSQPKPSRLSCCNCPQTVLLTLVLFATCTTN